MVKKLPVTQLNRCTNSNAQGTGGCRGRYIGCLGRLHRIADSAQTPKCWLGAVCMDLSDPLLSQLPRLCALGALNKRGATLILSAKVFTNPRAKR